MLKKKLLVPALILCLHTLASAAGAQAPVERGEYKTTALEYKAGKNTPPEWILAAAMHGASSLADMPEYRGRHCVIVEIRGSELAPLYEALNTKAAELMGAQMGRRQSSFEAIEHKAAGGDAAERSYHSLISAVFTPYTRVVKEDDWWVKEQVVENGKKNIRYTLFGLFSIDKTEFDRNVKNLLLDGGMSRGSLLIIFEEELSSADSEPKRTFRKEQL